MFIADGWNDFRVLDAGNGMKLERWKGVTLLRPDPQAVWPMDEHKADAIYIRSETGGGDGDGGDRTGDDRRTVVFGNC